MVGAGYVGLVSAACFADFGYEVTCVDVDRAKLDKLRSGRIPIYEPGLDVLIRRNSDSGRLTFTDRLAEAVGQADIVFIAVGTPSRRGDGHADLSHVYQAARAIGEAVRGDTVVATKSTVPVGTGDEVERIIAEQDPNGRVWVVSNPEFLREGSAIEDFKRPDRVVIGTEDPEAQKAMAVLYRPLSLNKAPVMVTDRRTAELTKYAGNAFLAMKITFINEIAELCERLGADVQDVARGIGMDKRIGAKFLHPGPGYGGSCFPKDTLALVKTAQDAESPVRLIETVIAVNDERKRVMARKIIGACGGTVRGRTIAILGLSFKPNTDDMRAAPSIAIIQALQDEGAKIRVYDPAAMEVARFVLDGVEYGADAYDAARGADAVAIVTEWDELRSLDLVRLAAEMSGKLLVDLRNVYETSDAETAGLEHFCVGRGSMKKACRS